MSFLHRIRDSANNRATTRHITLEKNGVALDFIRGDVSAGRINAIQVCLLKRYHMQTVSWTFNFFFKLFVFAI